MIIIMHFFIAAYCANSYRQMRVINAQPININQRLAYFLFRIEVIEREIQPSRYPLV